MEYQDVFAIPISELLLSARSHNCLKNMGIERVADLVQRTEAQLLFEPNFGQISLQDVVGVLRPLGLYLGMKVRNRVSEEIMSHVAALRAEADCLERLANETPFLTTKANEALVYLFDSKRSSRWNGKGV